MLHRGGVAAYRRTHRRDRAAANTIGQLCQAAARLPSTSTPLRRGPVVCGDHLGRDRRRAPVPTAPTKWCALPDSTSPCIPQTANVSQDICPTKDRLRCGGQPTRRPNLLLAPAHRTTPTITRSPNGPATENNAAARTPHWRWNVSCCAAAITPCVNWARSPWHHLPRNGRPPEMPCARAMPTNHLMPAASSLTRTVAILLDRRPEKTERPHSSQPARRAPYPSSCRRT